MARKAVPLRLEPELIAEIDAAAKAIDTNRTYFIEDAIKARLHLAKTYVAMDNGPPKKAKAPTMKPGGVNLVDGMADVAVIAGRVKAKARAKTTETRSIRGYDAATGEPIYR
jgi:uncharacterized protein with beta-barrel porin domain